MTRYLGPKTDPANVATQADKLSLSSETPDALTPDQTGAAGTAITAARSDHQHEILAGAAGTITGVSNAEGSSTSFARADHTHAISLPRCRVVRSTAQSIGSGTATIPITWDASADFDTNSFFTSGTKVIIPSGLGGIYLIVSTVNYVANATGFRDGSIFINGANAFGGGRATQPATNGLSTNIASSVILNLSASDEIELMARQNSGGDLNVTAALALIRLG